MNRRLAFTFIIVTLIIDAMGIGLILPVMPDLLQHVNGGDLGNAALWGGVLTTMFAAIQFLVGPTLGSLSDQYGRRPILIFSTAVIAVDYLIMGLANSIWLLLLLRVIAGIASATQSTATAFIADVSTPEEKAANFGILGAAFGIGFILGPLIGGLLGGYFDFRAPFFAAAALAGMNLMLGIFVLPETVTGKIRRKFDWRRANPVGALMQIKKLAGLGRLLLLFFLYDFAFFAYPAIWAYFTKERFDWSPEMIGYSLAGFGISIAFVQGYLIRKIIPAFGERKVLIFGLFFSLIMFTLLAFVTSGPLVMVLTPIAAMGAMVVPTLQGLISKMARDDQQGEVQGIVSSIRSLAVLMAPLVMTYVFFAATRPDGPVYQPGAPFMVSMLFVVLCLILFLSRPKGTWSKVQ
ncbi:MAG: MFS transporter [Planktomarina sp.]